MVLTAIRARRLHNKARFLWRDGQGHRAVEEALRALDLLPPQVGGSLSRVVDRVSILVTLAEFASGLVKHDKAQRRCDEALTLLERTQPTDGRNKWLVEVLVYKGNSQRLMARFDEASATLNRALEITEHVSDSPALPAGPLNALGILAKDRGDYEEAAGRYNQALELLRIGSVANSAQLAGIYHNLAGLAHAQGRFEQAEEPAREAVRLRRSAVPQDPDGLAADLSVLGSVLAGLERFEEAASTLSEALTLWRSRYGDWHYEAAVQLNNLAAIYQSQGAYAPAEAALEEALAIKRGTLGDNHPEIASLLNNLATVYTDTGRTRDAVKCYDEAIEIFGQTLGENHPSTLVCIQNRRNLAA